MVSSQVRVLQEGTGLRKSTMVASGKWGREKTGKLVRGQSPSEKNVAS